LRIKTLLFLGKTNVTIYWCNKNKNEINWGGCHCLVVSNGVVSVPLEGALVAGVSAVFNFVSVTSVGVAAAATTVSSIVVVGGPSVTTVFLLKTFKLQFRSSDLEIGENQTWLLSKRLNRVRDTLEQLRGENMISILCVGDLSKNKTYVLNIILVLIGQALAHGDGSHRQNAESDKNLRKYSNNCNDLGAQQRS
jgi:hypothetical protein